MRLSDQSRGCIRSILVTIIIGTIPFYLLGIVVWLTPGADRPAATSQPDLVNTSDAGDSGDSGGSDGNPTWTPIDLDDIVTVRPSTGTVTFVTGQPTSILSSPQPTIVVFTSTPTRDFVPIVPTSAPVLPTATLTRTPTSTPTLTNTVPPAPTFPNTPLPTAAPLLPPTDTPAP